MRSFFVYTSAMTPQIGSAPWSLLAHPGRCQVMASLEMGFGEATKTAWHRAKFAFMAFCDQGVETMSHGVDFVSLCEPLGSAHDRCHGRCVNKKAPDFDAFKWPLRCLYWFLWSVTWSEYSFKWQLHLNIVKIGTKGLIPEPQALTVFKGRPQ